MSVTGSTAYDVVAELAKQLAQLKAELVGARASEAALRRERDAAHAKLDQFEARAQVAEERARVAELQEMVGVTREMTAAGFVSRDLVEQALNVIDEAGGATGAAAVIGALAGRIARARVLLKEALGR